MAFSISAFITRNVVPTVISCTWWSGPTTRCVHAPLWEDVSIGQLVHRSISQLVRWSIGPFFSLSKTAIFFLQSLTFYLSFNLTFQIFLSKFFFPYLLFTIFLSHFYFYKLSLTIFFKILPRQSIFHNYSFAIFLS